MTTITTQWIVDKLNSITIESLNKKADLANKKEELTRLDLYNDIQDLEQQIRDLGKEDNDIREQWKQLLIDSWVKKFESLNGTTIQLNKKPWKLIIWDEDNIWDEYRKIKTTTTIDKKAVKEDILQWVIIEWVYIEEDYNLVIKHK